MTGPGCTLGPEAGSLEAWLHSRGPVLLPGCTSPPQGNLRARSAHPQRRTHGVHPALGSSDLLLARVLSPEETQRESNRSGLARRRAGGGAAGGGGKKRSLQPDPESTRQLLADPTQLRGVSRAHARTHSRGSRSGARPVSPAHPSPFAGFPESHTCTSHLVPLPPAAGCGRRFSWLLTVTKLPTSASRGE